MEKNKAKVIDAKNLLAVVFIVNFIGVYIIR
jgi:hypothetical protein